MSERRFSLLEREGPERPEREDEPKGLPRALERDGELGLDESGAEYTHFCRSCEAETRSGVASCYNCGSAIGGADQDLFDELKRRELAAEEQTKDEARRRAAAVEAARAELERERAAEQEQLEPSAPAVPVAQQAAADPRLTFGVLVVCLFATVSATLHMFLSATYADDTNWSVLAEVAIATIATWVAFTVLQSQRS